MPFRLPKRMSRPTDPTLQIVAVNGCCYGRDNRPDKGDYFRYCGQRFWEFISGSDQLYVEIIEPLGHKARQKNEEFLEEYPRILNKSPLEFSQRFCVAGSIDWESLVAFNSAVSKPKHK